MKAYDRSSRRRTAITEIRYSVSACSRRRDWRFRRDESPSASAPPKAPRKPNPQHAPANQISKGQSRGRSP